MNPDVRVLPGCLAALVAALGSGAAAAGPRFYWDEERRMLLPPGEERGRAAELLALLAAHDERWAARARRRWRRHARRHWQALRPVVSHALSGSLLALSRAAWRRVGPFDTGFRLYFEETDWLRRARRLGLPALHVPAAEAIHLHARSAAREPRAGEWFEDSARRFRERHYGRAFTRLLALADLRLPRRPAVRLSALPRRGPDLAGRSFPLWIEVSPNPTGYPAAAERLDRPPEGGWRLPADVAARLSGAELALQLVDERGRELGRWALSPAQAPKALGAVSNRS
jgi:GT2 family glycosyltransferase